MATLVEHGHDISGPTASRPTNADPGCRYFDTDLNQYLVWNGSAWQDAADSSSPSVTAAAGTAGSGTTPGGAGGSATVVSGAGGAKSGTGAAAGGAGGAIGVTAGAGGATASSGSNAGGAGGSVTVTGGAGGAASAGTGNGGAGGNINLVPGAGGATTGGSAGAAGEVLINGAAGLMQANCVYGEATPIDAPFFVACRAYRVKSIIHRPLVVGSDGSPVTAVVKKVASGTAIASGTALHSGTLDLKGSINTNATPTLSTTPSDLNIAAGDAIGLDVSGTTTAARGTVSVLLVPV